MSDLPLTQEVAALLLGRGLMLATAESCTGGLIAGACTDLAGSSLWFDRGFVTYSNAAKHDMLGVASDLIERHVELNPILTTFNCNNNSLKIIVDYRSKPFNLTKKDWIADFICCHTPCAGCSGVATLQETVDVINTI
jgi:hypothetical protein